MNVNDGRRMNGNGQDNMKKPMIMDEENDQ